jgi:hypothetical protein
VKSADRLSTRGRHHSRTATTRPEGRIPHARILSALREELGEARDLVRIYHDRVLRGPTRTMHLLGRKCTSTLLETLLGYELQAAYKRIQCPDLVTARYLRVFTDIGCRTVKLPYDPTVTAELVPLLEGFYDGLNARISERFPSGRPLQLYVVRRICAHLRRALAAP